MITLILNAITSVAWASTVAIPCHQIFLGRVGGIRGAVCPYRTSHWPFLAYAALFYIGLMGIGFAWFQLINFFAGFILVLPLVIYLLSRFMLVLPDAAVGENLDLKESWRRTAGKGWRLPLLLVGIPFLIGFLLGPFLSADLSVVGEIILNSFIVVILIIEVGVLSLAYKELSHAE